MGALSKTEPEEWRPIVRGCVEAMKAAGILRERVGLQWSSAATTVRTTDGKLQVLDGPYADTKEQLGGASIHGGGGSRPGHFLGVPLGHRDPRCRRDPSVS